MKSEQPNSNATNDRSAIRPDDNRAWTRAFTSARSNIIEWLAPGNRKTGWELSEAISGMAETHQPPVSIAFKRVKTRDEFLAYVRSIRDNFRETRLLPLLHVETHGITLDRPGGPHGIGSGVDDSVLWADLMHELIPLNELTQLRLFVTLAACEGIWGMQMLQPVERSAFLVLFGPRDAIDEDPLADGMQAFYTSMFGAGNGNMAFKAANDAVDANGTTFLMINAEMAFRMVYGAFLRERCTPEEFAKRAASILHGLRWKFFIDHGKPMPMQIYRMLQEQTHQQVENHDAHFEELRRNYFFIDRFPENAQRFLITLKDCLREEY